MKNASPKVDAYIAEAAPFAQPILRKIRKLFHQACPEIQEEIKWNAPTFMHEGIVAGMVAFKAHVRRRWTIRMVCSATMARHS
tara:strand:- start:6792 stop:7040 length:249 start_codon:yes stop_codon:yes gene_type:complete